jgi:hypothetical protein
MSGEIVQVTGYLRSFMAELYVLAAAADAYQGVQLQRVEGRASTFETNTNN